MLIEALAYHERTKYLIARSISKTNKGKCACKVLNQNYEDLHIRRNTIVGTFEPIYRNDILLTFTDDTRMKEINDSDQPDNINVVTVKPKENTRRVSH